jgi:hypothetical protein
VSDKKRRDFKAEFGSSIHLALYIALLNTTIHKSFKIIQAFVKLIANCLFYESDVSRTMEIQRVSF